MAATAGSLQKNDWVIIKVALIAQEKAYRRAAAKYSQEGKVEFKKLVDRDLAELARVLMLVGEIHG